MYKTQVWVVVAISDGVITLEREGERITLSASMFTKVFDYSFATTVHKCQGLTFNEHYNVYEAEKMTLELLYTAISRGTRLAYVHVVSCAARPYQPIRRSASITVELAKPVKHVGRVYCITLSDGSMYIGKTTKSLQERLREHLMSPTNASMAGALDRSAKIDVLEEITYTHEDALSKLERRYIESALSSGVRLLNVQHAKEASVVEEKPKIVEKREKIRIRIDEGKRCYEVWANRKGFDAVDTVKKRYYWRDDAAAALAEAEAWRTYLLNKYF